MPVASSDVVDPGPDTIGALWPAFTKVNSPDSRLRTICLVIVVSQACSSVGVSDGEGRFSYPVRRETGIERVARMDTPAIKSHRKSDNRNFLVELKQFARDN